MTSNTIPNLATRVIGLLVFSVLLWLTAKHHWVDNALNNPARVGALIGLVVLLCIVGIAVKLKDHRVSFVAGAVVAVALTFWALTAFPKGSTWHFFAALVAVPIFAIWILFGTDVLKIFSRRRSTRKVSDPSQDDQDDPVVTRFPNAS